MARTLLFARLRRAYALARLSNRTGLTAIELVQRRAAGEPSRRDFLRVSTAAAGVVALGGCAPGLGIGGRDPDGPVVIVGAGIAGLTAAHRLRQAGVPVRVYEAQNRIGGRMFSLHDHFADGQVVELGGELIDTNHIAIRRLAAELMLDLDDLADEEPGVGGEVVFVGGRAYSDAEIVEAFRPVAAAVEAALAPLGEDTTYADDGGAAELDRTTLEAWFDRHVGTGWFRTFLDVAYTTEYGLETGEQSALNFVYMIDPNPDPFHVFGDSDERFHVRGGNDLIPRRLAQGLDDAIETGAVLEAVSTDPDGRYRLSFQRRSGSFEVAAERVILALPFTLLRRVDLDLDLPAVKRAAIRDLGYGTNAKLMVGFEERVWRTEYRRNGSVVTDLPFQLTWETSRKQPGRSGVLTNFTGGRHGVEVGGGTAAQWAGRLAAELDRVFPGALAARGAATEVRFHWPTHPWTLGSYASYLPGQWSGIRGAEGQAVAGLHFAGEHTSLEFQGFMEGGCESGERAAREVLEGLGRRSAPRGRPRSRRSLLAGIGAGG